MPTTGLTGFIQANQIAANSITAGQIAANTITASQIATNTITASQIAASTITGGNIAASTITANNIAANTITASQIASNSITADRITSGSITATQIAANTITASNLVQTSALITNSAQIGSAVIQNANIGDAQVDNLKIGPNAVSLPAFQNSSVTTPIVAGAQTFASFVVSSFAQPATLFSVATFTYPPASSTTLSTGFTTINWTLNILLNGSSIYTKTVTLPFSTTASTTIAYPLDFLNFYPISGNNTIQFQLTNNITQISNSVQMTYAVKYFYIENRR